MSKKRVKFFRSLIYAFVILVLFLPLILMSFLTLRMISISQIMQEQLQALTSAISQPAPQVFQSSQPYPQEGYVLEPEDQSIIGESPKPQELDGQNLETTGDGQLANASGAQPEASGTPSEQLTSGTGADAVNDVGNNALSELSVGSKINDGTLGGADNPDTVNSADPSPPNYNGNPGMGC